MRSLVFVPCAFSGTRQHLTLAIHLFSLSRHVCLNTNPAWQQSLRKETLKPFRLEIVSIALRQWYDVRRGLRTRAGKERMQRGSH
jgi:hypothetical protein